MKTEGKVKSYKGLLVWRKGIELMKDIYRLTSDLPSKEKYGLVSQMRRAAVSVPSNIAEGQARKSSSKFRQFLFIALGSLAELETQLIVSTELNYCKTESANVIIAQVHELQKMAHSLQDKLATRH